MKILFFSTKQFEEDFFTNANSHYNHSLTFMKENLTPDSAIETKGYVCVCASVRDTVNETVLKQLKKNGVGLLALRSAGFDHVDLASAKKLGIVIAYVPTYSPNSIAEHAVMLMLSLNRKIVEAAKKVHTYDFSLDGLLGFEMQNKTVGIIGTGKIGIITAKILQGFGCNLIAYDVFQNPECKKLGIPYVSLEEVYTRSDIISLHCPLTVETEYLINEKSIAMMKKGVMIINTARGKLINTDAAIKGLQTEKIGYLGLDVYENEKGIFFENKSKEGIQDENLKELLSFSNVLITAHQGSFTSEAKKAIADSILHSTTEFEKGNKLTNFL
jgi:D-lactate dehydrogenase